MDEAMRDYLLACMDEDDTPQWDTFAALMVAAGAATVEIVNDDLLRIRGTVIIPGATPYVVGKTEGE